VTCLYFLLGLSPADLDKLPDAFEAAAEVSRCARWEERLHASELLMGYQDGRWETARQAVARRRQWWELAGQARFLHDTGYDLDALDVLATLHHLYPPGYRPEPLPEPGPAPWERPAPPSPEFLAPVNPGGR
jgi:hypothetical protein